VTWQVDNGIDVQQEANATWLAIVGDVATSGATLARVLLVPQCLALQWIETNER